MSGLLLGMSVAAIVGLAALGLILRLRRRRARQSERRSRPAALQDAELLHVEKTFKTTRPVPIAAKVDRVYRLPSGLLVLVELKTRWNGKPSISDVIHLSAQRLALSGSTGEPVASQGFVLIAWPGVRRSHFAHRVDLLSTDQVVTLVERRAAILSGRASPRYAVHAGDCRQCAFRLECDGAA